MLGLGDKEQAVEHLQRAVDEHPPIILALKTDPLWDDIRADPRFVAGLPVAEPDPRMVPPPNAVRGKLPGIPLPTIHGPDWTSPKSPGWLDGAILIQKRPAQCTTSCLW